MKIDLSSIGTMPYELTRARLMLGKASQEMEQELVDALLRNARLMRDRAKQLVHVDTGSCRKSIRVERRGRTHIAVRAGGYIVNPKTRRKVDYAGILEQRYPYMRPAWNMIQPLLERDLINIGRRLLP